MEDSTPVVAVDTTPVVATETTTQDGAKPNTSGDSPEARAARYQFQQARELEKLQKKAATPAVEKPVFNEENDPDGSKEMEYRAKAEAEKVYAENAKSLEERLEAAERRQAIEDLRRDLSSDSKDFEKIWITINTEAAINVLHEIEKAGGLTPRQLNILAHSEQLMKSALPKKTMPAPGEGGVVKPTEAPKTRREAFDAIWAAHWM